MKNFSLYEKIETLIEYIEDNIEEKLTLETLSDVAGLSKFHLIRVFKKISDSTLMNYVRSRKLASSLNPLLNTDMRIIDVANQYNFEHEQTYIRSFKNEYRITPAKFRRSHTPVKIVDKINFSFCKEFEHGVLFNPQFVVKPEFKVVGIKDIISEEDNFIENEANNRGVDFFFNHRHKIKNAINPNTYIGLTRVINNESDYTYYMPSIQVSEFNDIPQNMYCDTIPASKYAVFQYVGNHPVEEISNLTMLTLFDYIFQTWIPKLNYDFSKEGGFHFEEINSEIASENYCEANLYFPISL
ncbi:helix-turn-helix domain-containing protein [Oceanirhabdus sp. W0125-5]|uniref:helix-turn-helix domain-containing protein n=1 Tax=Oceanirhabdus sp. W0125-5 TaxID=2999116 RepID=UPI0022F2CA84|nr:helix-turn-helix domain-containing protein [Oceanirhabdus sp. W0125-5]WBW97223.1 helix-turn-helix domain-containing protein [Oceanirhabdus sp. W0125-5]